MHVKCHTLTLFISKAIELSAHRLHFLLSTGYERVRCNMDDITSALKSTPGATDKLTGKYKQEGWMDINEHPTEDKLVTLALQRIKQDPKQYDLFIDMLRDIPGMDLTVNSITSS